jgi:hypothetical protein
VPKSSLQIAGGAVIEDGKSGIPNKATIAKKKNDKPLEERSSGPSEKSEGTKQLQSTPGSKFE